MQFSGALVSNKARRKETYLSEQMGVYCTGALLGESTVWLSRLIHGGTGPVL